MKRINARYRLKTKKGKLILDTEYKSTKEAITFAKHNVSNLVNNNWEDYYSLIEIWDVVLENHR